jgi:hypothetical protein
MFKKTLFIAATAATLFSIGCVDELSKLTEFDVPLKTTIPIPVLPYTTLIDTVSLASPKFNTGIKKIFEDYSTSRDLLDQVTLNTLTLTSKDSTSGAASNFDFLKSVTLFVKADGLAEKQLATLDSIPTGASKLTFATSKVNMTDYIAKDQLSIRMFIKQRGPNTTALKAECNMTFHVNAKILGK